MKRGAAAGNRDLRHRAQQRFVDVQFGGELRIAGFVDAAGERLLHDTRLHEHLLEHEMFEAVLFSRGRVPHHLRHFALDGVSEEIGKRVAAALYDDHLAFAQNHLFARVLQDRGSVGGYEHLVFPDADHERARTAAREHQPPRSVGGDNSERKGPTDFAQRLAYGADEVAPDPPQIFLNKVGEHFGIGLAAKGVPGCLESIAQRNVIFDDAVVDDRDLRAAIQMRMRVDIGGASVRRPARVPETRETGERLREQPLREPVELSLGFRARKHALAIEHGDSGAIVPAILEPLQRIKNDRDAVPETDIPDNSAHWELPWPLFCEGAPR